MGAKHTDSGADAPAAAVTDPAQVRNVVLVGPSGCGKTSLAESLLATTGMINKAGSVTEGNTVCDHDPAAVRQQRSVRLAVAPLYYGDHKINLVDVPGYVDFLGELRAGLRAADAAVFVISAAEGIDAATEASWRECAAVGKPRGVVISRLDNPRADIEGTLRACREAFGDTVLPLYMPVTGSDGEVTGLLGTLTQQLYDYSVDNPPRVTDPTEADRERLAPSRAELIEGIIAESEDETLMDRYLGGEQLEPDMLIADLEKAVARGGFHPVIPVCSATGVGLSELLDGIVRGFPSPLEHRPPEVADAHGDPVEVAANPAGPLLAEVVRTAADPFVGRVSLLRMFSGTLRPEHEIHVSGHGLAERGHEEHDMDERVAHIYSPLGATLRETSECVAGDLCALTKIGSAETGDTVSDPSHPMSAVPWEMPEPLLPVAVVARSRNDEDALARNLARITAGDPTLYLERNTETQQLVLWCLGEAHAEVILQRLRDGGAEVDTEPVRVVLRQTFSGPASGHGKHVKQSGGHGQYAVCDIEVEPLARGSGFEFVDRIVGGVIPNQFITSVRKGIEAQMARGLQSDCPLVDLRVSLVDGKAHSVDSSDAAFQTAGSLALKEAAATAGLTTLEPVDEVKVRIPDEYLGTILGDLSGRRGKVLGTEPDGSGTTLVHAEIPATALTRYVIDLRSLSSGTAQFTRRFARYEPMPENAVPTG